LEPIAQMLASDGYRLVVGVDGDVIDVGIEATPEACIECLVPEEIMEQIIRAKLTEADPAAATGKLNIRYPVDNGVHD
jgi:hypothetical protein